MFAIKKGVISISKFRLTLIVVILGLLWSSIALSADKAKALAKFKQYSDTNRVNACQDLFWVYLRDKPDSSLYYANTALALSKELSFLRGEASAYRSLSAYYNRVAHEPIQAARNGLKSYFIYKDLNYLSGLKMTLYELSNIFLNIGLYKNAVDVLHEYIKYSQMINDSTSIHLAYVMLADAYLSAKDSKKATELVPIIKSFGDSEKYNYSYAQSVLYALHLTTMIADPDSSKKYSTTEKIDRDFKDGFLKKDYVFIGLIYYNSAIAKNELGFYKEALADLDTAFVLSKNVMLLEYEYASFYELKHEILANLKMEDEAYIALLKRNELEEIREKLRFELVELILIEQRIYTESTSKRVNALLQSKDLDMREKEAKSEQRFLFTVAMLLISIMAILAISLQIIRRKNKELKKQNESLLKANNELDQFAYRVSHDLRAPITSALGLMRVFKLETDFQMQQNYLSLAIKSLEGLDGIIQDIIKFTRNSTQPIKSVYFEPRKIIEEIFIMLKFMPRANNLVYEINAPSDYLIYSDLERFKMIIGNLISNAIKFSTIHSHSPKIIVNITNVENKRSIFEIIDNGPGIAETSREKLFSMFYRATNIAPGSGLGLFIANEAAKRINGTIEFKPNPDGGSIFSLIISE